MVTVYLPTFTIKDQPHVGKYTSPMDPMDMEKSYLQHLQSQS